MNTRVRAILPVYGEIKRTFIKGLSLTWKNLLAFSQEFFKLKAFKQSLISSSRKWDKFWFEAQGEKQIKWFRIGLSCTLLGAVLARTGDLSFFYSDQGLMRSALVSDIFPGSYRYSLFQFFTGEAALWIGHILLLLSLSSLALGFYPRLSAIIALILHVSFIHRNMAIIYGLDSIATYFLFFLCLADGGKTKKSSPLGSVAFRLAQIQVCIIYAYSGLQKLRGGQWWQGEALWDVLTNHQLTRWDFSWVSHFPLLLIVATYLTLAWEIYFPVLVWVKPTRRPALWAGTLMHLGIGIALNLTFFASIMICTYILFLESQELARFESRLKNLSSQLKTF